MKIRAKVTEFVKDSFKDRKTGDTIEFYYFTVMDRGADKPRMDQLFDIKIRKDDLGDILKDPDYWEDKECYFVVGTPTLTQNRLKFPGRLLGVCSELDKIGSGAKPKTAG